MVEKLRWAQARLRSQMLRAGLLCHRRLPRATVACVLMLAKQDRSEQLISQEHLNFLSSIPGLKGMIQTAK